MMVTAHFQSMQAPKILDVDYAYQLNHGNTIKLIQDHFLVSLQTLLGFSIFSSHIRVSESVFNYFKTSQKHPNQTAQNHTSQDH